MRPRVGPPLRHPGEGAEEVSERRPLALAPPHCHTVMRLRSASAILSTMRWRASGATVLLGLGLRCGLVIDSASDPVGTSTRSGGAILLSSAQSV